VRGAWLALVLSFAVLACRRPPGADSTYLDAVAAQRQRRVDELTSPEGWLTLVARQFLAPGPNVVGSDPAAAISLEATDLPARAGAFDLRPDGTVVFVTEPGAPASVNGLPPTSAPLVPEGTGRPDVVTVGRFRLTVFRKDGRVAVRARDPESSRRLGFRGLEYFPVDPSHRVEARFETYAEPRSVEIPTSHGGPFLAHAPGLVRFVLGGRELALEPTLESPADETLFFVFADATSGTSTYGAGRFLTAARPRAGDSRVVLDFNLAENPPCALTPFASCPMALPRNTLPVPVEAGEKTPRER
jgi:hypothetical protein